MADTGTNVKHYRILNLPLSKKYMKIISSYIVVTVLVLSCSPNNSPLVETQIGVRTDTIGGVVFYVSDSPSRLIISHHEGTEYLDAYVDSGTVYLSDSLISDIRSEHAEHGNLPHYSDLRLTGENRITEILFGDSTNYGELWHNKYEITGKAIGLKHAGILFRVDSYRKIED